MKRAAGAIDVNIFDWKSADAFAERFQNLKKLQVPAGFFDIGGKRPRENLTVLGSSVSVLVGANLHPALQWALILATRDYHENNYDHLGDGTLFPKNALTRQDRSVLLRIAAIKPAFPKSFPIYPSIMRRFGKRSGRES